MDCTIKHESLGRLRIHLHQCYMTLPEADQVEYWIKELAGVNRVKVYDRTADATILYDGKTDTRQRIIDCLSSFDYKTCKLEVPEHTGREIQRYYEDKMFDHIAARIITRWFLPVPIRSSIRLIKAVPFVLHGLKSLSKGKLDVHVLDATSVTFALIRQDFDTAGSVMFLLGIGDIMEEWTHRKSVDDLANAMSLHIDKVWRKEKDTNTLVPIMEIKLNDQIIVRTGNMIPLDGLVVSGDAMVNQSSITGEPLSVHKSEGAPVFAGTVMDEGQLVIQVTKVSGSGQYDRRFRKIKIKYRNTNIQSCRSLISGNICGNSSDLSVHTKCDPCLLDHDG